MKHLVKLYNELVAQSGHNGGHLETIKSVMDTDYFGEDECEEGEECEGSHEHRLEKKIGVNLLKQYEGEFK